MLDAYSDGMAHVLNSYSGRGNGGVHINHLVLDITFMSIVLLAVFLLPVLQCTITSMFVHRLTKRGPSEYWRMMHHARDRNSDKPPLSAHREHGRDLELPRKK